jgi:processive 1,2-diacylglycerol beta-glucosyltransferase
MKILFLPFLKISTGHHAVAEALIRSLKKRIYNIDCKKIDIFSYTDKLLEKAFRVTYLKWIDHSPETFEWIYRNFVYPSNSTKHLNLYEKKFLVKMKNLIENEQPNLIVCTQAFPSFLISRLRYYGVITPPVINVYTDFFINSLWGIHGIDYHFVPDFCIKKQLENKYNIHPNHVFVTGVPVDDCFLSSVKSKSAHSLPYHILVSGGNSGLGEIQQLISKLPIDNNYYFSVLCGHNKKLYREIIFLNQSNIKPLSYISSRETMNALYDGANAIITKPGGVTLSEALWKRLPIFVHASLPGQEDVNKEFLLKRKLIKTLDLNTSIAVQLNSFFSDVEEQNKLKQRVDEYISQFECLAWQKIMELTIKTMLKPPKVATFSDYNNLGM